MKSKDRSAQCLLCRGQFHVKGGAHAVQKYAHLEQEELGSVCAATRPGGCGRIGTFFCGRHSAYWQSSTRGRMCLLICVQISGAKSVLQVEVQGALHRQQGALRLQETLSCYRKLFHFG